MNREIKFRGKYSDRHPWVYGHFYNNCDIGVNMNIIINFDENEGTGKEYQISPYFLRQYTGLNDKHGKEIYEGDILHYTEHPGYLLSTTNMIVCWNDEYAGFGYKAKNMHGFFMSFWNHDELKKDVLDHCEIIGNIYDNPGLLQPAREHK